MHSQRNIALRDDADHAAGAVHCGNAPDPMRFHNRKRLIAIVVGRAAHNIRGHHFANCDLAWIAILSQRFNREVAIRNDTNKVFFFLIFDYGQDTDILVRHKLRSLVDVLCRQATDRILGHQVAAFFRLDANEINLGFAVIFVSGRATRALPSGAGRNNGSITRRMRSGHGIDARLGESLILSTSPPR